MKIVRTYCVGAKCLKENACDMVDHEVLGLFKEEGRTATYRHLKCTLCGHVIQEVIPSISKRKTTYPYYHEGLGQTFSSESHEQSWTKANGYTKE